MKTPGEIVRDKMSTVGLKTIGEGTYNAGNRTNDILEIVEKTKTVIDGKTTFAVGTESASALNKIGFKLKKNFGHGDKVWTGLCVISAGCEPIALACSTVFVILFKGKIYVKAKIINKGYVSFKNACANEGY